MNKRTFSLQKGMQWLPEVLVDMVSPEGDCHKAGFILEKTESRLGSRVLEDGCSMLQSSVEVTNC